MRLDAAVPVLPLAGVVPFPQSPHPYLVSAPVGGAGGRAAAFYQPAFSPMADVGVIAEVLPCGEGGLLECTPLDRVRRTSDGALDVVADTPLDESAAEEAARLHGELWTLLATLRGADAADGPLTSLRPGAASPSHASLALASCCELGTAEQQRLLETVDTIERLRSLEVALREAAGVVAARAALASLNFS